MGKDGGEANGVDGGGDVSLSVEESNRLRAKLGLPPLREEKGKDSRTRDEGRSEEKKLAANKLKERIDGVKERRKLTESVFGTSTLGVEEDDEKEADAQSWVERTRIAEERRKEKIKQAREKKVATSKRLKRSSGKELAGVQIKHSLGTLGDEPIILTLADKSILDENQEGINAEEDELENVLLREAEKAKKNAELKKKDFRKQYDPGAEGDDGTMLAKYDEEMEDTVRIGDGGIIEDEKSEEQRRLEVRKRLLLAKEKIGADDDGEPKIQSDYMTVEEASKFKSSKRKKKRRKEKKLRHTNAEEDLLDELENEGTTTTADDRQRSLLTAEQRKAKLDAIRREEMKKRQDAEAIEDDDLELRETLARARRAMNQVKGEAGLLKLQEDIKNNRKDDEEQMQVESSGIVLDETSEFVRNIRKPDEGEDLVPDPDLEFDRLQNTRPADYMDENAVGEGAENSDGDAEMGDVDGKHPEENDDEGPSDIGQAKGMAAALEHFRMVGDLRNTTDQVGRAKDERLAKELIENAGPRKDVQVKLEYIDEFGREMTQREAFRRLCYVFHGKGPSRRKQEKLLRQYVEEQKNKKKGTGPDTPLESVKALKKETQSSGQAHVVLSGASAISQAPSSSNRPTKLSKGD
ncbi:hypothetical protein NDN08_000248 [Rhodosorus marinus]|uniref:SART-1 family protein n=1 Tax=Rhodosorus marinus TaxID=101924 RepID=A0AAV8UES5_9RHOD|nr:hypothetical protein NDN08_000248 [Rhodosorus marinus]